MELAGRWGSESQYSHGYLVPAFAVYLLWARRQWLPTEFEPNVWGLPVLAGGLALRFAGTYLFFDWVSAISLLVCLFGICLLVGGIRLCGGPGRPLVFWFSWCRCLTELKECLGHPLQQVATTASTYALQTLGFPAYADGLVIRIKDIRIGVVEACSGLSMLQIFFALSTAVTLVSRGSVLERSVIFLSAVPIALAANITRIVVTGIMHLTVGSEWADYVFHDLAGWLMMPLALGMLLVVVKLLDWILVAPPAEDADTYDMWSTLPSTGTPNSQPLPKAVTS